VKCVGSGGQCWGGDGAGEGAGEAGQGRMTKRRDTKYFGERIAIFKRKIRVEFWKASDLDRNESNRTDFKT
jgi:hypothetical protein